MDFEIVWTEVGFYDFQESIRYISERNAAAAERIAEEILHKIKLLRDLPFMGRVYAAEKSGRTREVVSGKYRIFYEVDEDAKRVEILRVWHSKRGDPQL